jgi:hypothetical protein
MNILRSPRILLTARDPSSAEAMRILRRAMLQDRRLEVCIATQEPAYRILNDDSVIPNNNLFIPTSSNRVELVNFASKLIADFSPDIVLTGISGPDFGIDEAVLSVAPQRKFSPYALQSYWGDMNVALQANPKTYLVIDDFAARLTETRTQERVVVVGSLKHSSYGLIDTLSSRRVFRDRIGVDGETCVVGLFGQPFGIDHPYRRTIEAFAEVVGRSAPVGTKFIYRPHPKEISEQTEWTTNLFSRYKLNFQLNEDNTLEHALCGCDYIVSAFSTCGYDLQQLLRNSNAPLGSPVYLMFERDLVSWFKQYTKLTKIPMSDRGMAIVVSNASSLPFLFESYAVQRNRQTCWENIVRHFPKNCGSPTKIIDMLLANFREDCEEVC